MSSYPSPESSGRSSRLSPESGGVPADFPDYRECRLCPRRCGVDRARGETGACGETAQCRLASACLHHGEEPSIYGARGSGTLFFSGCSTRCFFCQNYSISQGGAGRTVSFPTLLAAAERLAAGGAHNLNFVTPDHFWPHIRALCGVLRDRGVSIPFVYNCSGYQSAEILPQVLPAMDIFLVDFKFADSALAAECMGDGRYPEIAAAAVRAMYSAKGPLRPWDPSGRRTARRGVLVRHLVLPGQSADSIALLRRLRAEVGPNLPLSIMSQYHPMPECRRRGRFTRRLRREEYDAVVREAERLGFERVYIQEDLGDDAYLPDFAGPTPFPDAENLLDRS